MILQRVIPFAHSLLKHVIHPGDIAVDATMGNGHDTYMLCELVEEEGHVYSFDIQSDAIHKTEQRLTEAKLAHRASLYEQSHEHVDEVLHKNNVNEIAAAIFNLGYLPGGDKAIVTMPKTTITAISKLLLFLKKGGLIVLVIYYGHEEGQVEKEQILPYLQNLNQEQYLVLQYQFINQKNSPPFVVAIEKK